MGQRISSALTKLVSAFQTCPPSEVLLVGLDAVGKTTIFCLLSDDDSEIIPTIGFNVKVLKVGKMTMRMWDIGGQKDVRTLWELYIKDAKALVFVFDVSYPEQWDASVEFLHKILKRRRDIVILILLNKVDVLNNDVSKIDEARRCIMSKCNLDPNGHVFKVFCISAKNALAAKRGAYGGRDSATKNIEDAFMWMGRAISGAASRKIENGV